MVLKKDRSGSNNPYWLHFRLKSKDSCFQQPPLTTFSAEIQSKLFPTNLIDHIFG